MPTTAGTPTSASTPPLRREVYYFTYQNWYNLSYPWPAAIVIGSSIFYLLLVYVIWPMFIPTSPGGKALADKLRKAHNILLFLYSGFCCTATLHFMWRNGELDILGPRGMDPLICNEELPEWLWYLNITFVFSKIYEWFDTMFLVLFKGKLTFLHVYHHCTTFWLFLLVSNFNSTIKQGMVLNGFVHTMMYAHYAWRFPKPLVPLITICQILQLIFVTFVWGETPRRCPLHHSFIERYTLEFWSPYAMVPVYLLFFVKFFVQRFILGGGEDGRKSKSKKAQ